MKQIKITTAILLVLAITAAILSGCSEEGQAAGEISEYDSQSFIPVGDTSGESADYSENTAQTVGFVVKDKKYDYDGNNLVILNVENQTDKNYKITINGQYLDGNGTVLKEESKSYEGFEAGWSNYFLFLPEISFDRFTYTLEAEEYDGKCYAQMLHYNWRLQEIERGMSPEDWSKTHEEQLAYESAVANGETDVPLPTEHRSSCIDFVLGVNLDAPFELCVVLDVVILDSQGEVFVAQPRCYNMKTDPNLVGDDNIDWKSKGIYYFTDSNSREWPDQLKGELTVLVGTVDVHIQE